MTDASRRDESTDALLRRTLSPGQEPETADACLDAETAAAWLDGKLHGSALERARTHVADCARCQALMATFVRAEAGLAQPAARATTPRVVETARRRPWWVWMVPVAAAAAVIVIVIMLPRQTSQVAQAPAAVPAPDQSKLADAKNAAAETPPVEEKKAEAPVAAKDVDQAAKLEVMKRQQDAKARAATAPAGAVATPAKEVAAAPPPPPQPPPAPAAASNESRMREMVQAPPLRRDEIGSPDPLVRWRLRRRTVEKSIDGGKSWTAVPTGIDADWTAGAAPAPTALWIVGRGGMVARSTDGRAFERVPFPELTDLSAVQATDAQTATVSSADGHTFTTTDGGRSWARRDLQEKRAAPFKE